MTTPTTAPMTCQRFALCSNPAVGTIADEHGRVPTCEHCADTATIDLWTPARGVARPVA